VVRNDDCLQIPLCDRAQGCRGGRVCGEHLLRILEKPCVGRVVGVLVQVLICYLAESECGAGIRAELDTVGHTKAVPACIMPAASMAAEMVVGGAHPRSGS
jgi:hypothetical protein